MATIKINNVTALTESSGTVTLDSGVTVPAASVIGLLSAGVALKVYTMNHKTDSGNQNASSGYNYGTALSIPSSDNPNGAKYLIIAGGGRSYAYASFIVNQIGVSLEGGATWTSTNGTEVTQIISPGDEQPTWWSCPATFGLYTNSSGGAVGVEFKTRLKGSAGSNCRIYNGEGNLSSGIIAIRVH